MSKPTGRPMGAPPDSARRGALARWGDPVARFWSKVDRRGPDECWPWKGTIGSEGYGQFWLGPAKGGRIHRATRRMWFLTYGVEPADDQMVCHRCDNPPCVNPAHLFLGTVLVNVHDARDKGRLSTTRNAGQDNGHALLTSDQVRELRRLHAGGAPTRELATRFGMAPRSVRQVASGQRYRNVR